MNVSVKTVFQISATDFTLTNTLENHNVRLLGHARLCEEFCHKAYIMKNTCAALICACIVVICSCYKGKTFLRLINVRKMSCYLLPCLLTSVCHFTMPRWHRQRWACGIPTPLDLLLYGGDYVRDQHDTVVLMLVELTQEHFSFIVCKWQQFVP